MVSSRRGASGKRRSRSRLTQKRLACHSVCDIRPYGGVISVTYAVTAVRNELIYLLHFSILTVSQNFSMPEMSSSFVEGLISRLMYSFSSCHKFSIGLRSGDSGGVFHQLIPSSAKNLFAAAKYVSDHYLA